MGQWPLSVPGVVKPQGQPDWSPRLSPALGTMVTNIYTAIVYGPPGALVAKISSPGFQKHLRGDGKQALVSPIQHSPGVPALLSPTQTPELIRKKGCQGMRVIIGALKHWDHCLGQKTAKASLSLEI